MAILLNLVKFIPMQRTIIMMIGMSIGVIGKTHCASWLFVYKYLAYIRDL